MSDLSDNRFLSPVEAEADVFTTSNGTLGFRNPSDCSTQRCISSSRRGGIQRVSRVLILPYALRERALEVRKEKRYNELWDAISVFNREMGVQAAGHLEFFLKHFRRELDEFRC